VGERLAAIGRLLLIIPAMIYLFLFAFVFYLVIIPYFVVDVIVQLIVGNDGLPWGGDLAGVWQWLIDNMMYILLNEGDWSWAP
jgi:hypothetical protein